jgi:GTP-binding protein Era
MTKTEKRFGAVALIGATNAGKSTLTNALVGEKVAITSHKVQTTRFQVRGIAIHEQSQMMLIDTPGFFQPRRKFDRAMIAAAWDSLEDVDACLYLIDASKPFSLKKHQDYLDVLLKETREDARILVLNKVDQAPRKNLPVIAATMNEACPFAKTFMVSALSGDGVKDIKGSLAAMMPLGEWAYEGDTLTTLPDRLLAAEITREQVYARLHKELPYHIAVETEEYGESNDGKGIALSQIIIIENKKHKPIILGKQGQTLKAIGSEARAELSRLHGCPVHLKLFIQHRPNWMDKDEALNLTTDPV